VRKIEQEDVEANKRERVGWGKGGEWGVGVGRGEGRRGGEEREIRMKGRGLGEGG